MTGMPGGTPSTAAVAEHARRALAATGGGTLLVDGLHDGSPGGPRSGGGRAAREIEVLLYEEDGEPRFLCDAGAPVAHAAARRRAAVLEVGCCRRSGCRREVRFAGRLVLLDTDDVDGTVVHVVGLALDTVLIRQPGADDIELPLAAYRESAPPAPADPGPLSESLAVYAERVVRHTNRAHADSLRAAAARLAGTTPDLVIAAEIADLTDQGFTVHWIGADGARSSPLSFARAARSPDDLAVLLRGALSA